jgi:hypothetical protein
MQLIPHKPLIQTLQFLDQANKQALPGATTESATIAFSNLLSQVLNIALVIATIAVLFYLIWGAIDWITAGGDKGKTDKAREKITQSIIGLVLLISSMAIIMFVQNLFGYCLINIGGTCSATSSRNSTTQPNRSPRDCQHPCVVSAQYCADGGGQVVTGSCSNNPNNPFCCNYN